MKTMMSDAAQIATDVIALRAAGNKEDAGLVLACGAERLGRDWNLAYSDAKQTIGTLLGVHA